MSCPFCQIITRQLPAQILYEDEQVIAIQDIRPIAPVHLLILPKEHIQSVNELEPAHEAIAGHMFTVARQLALQFGVAESGYRLMVNTGAHGGQSVFHLHMHLIGGRHLPLRFG